MKENKLNIVILLVSLYLIDSAKFQITGSISPLTFHEQLSDIVVTCLCPIHLVNDKLLVCFWRESMDLKWVKRRQSKFS